MIMNRVLNSVIALAVGTVMSIAVTAPTIAADEPENIIKYRQNVMKAVGAHLTNVAAVVKGEVSLVGNVPANADAIVDLLGQAGDLFPEGTAEGKTRAKPEIWSEWDKFVASLKETREKAAALQSVAGSGDVAQIGQALGDLGKACGGCHKPYRKEK